MGNSINFGVLSSIEGIKDNHGVSSEGEHSEGATKEVKKPRLGESRETQKKDNNTEILDEGNTIAEDKTETWIEWDDWDIVNLLFLKPSRGSEIVWLDSSYVSYVWELVHVKKSEVKLDSFSGT